MEKKLTIADVPLIVASKHDLLGDRERAHGHVLVAEKKRQRRKQESPGRRDEEERDVRRKIRSQRAGGSVTRHYFPRVDSETLTRGRSRILLLLLLATRPKYNARACTCGDRARHKYRRRYFWTRVRTSAREREEERDTGRRQPIFTITSFRAL